MYAHYKKTYIHTHVQYIQVIETVMVLIINEMKRNAAAKLSHTTYYSYTFECTSVHACYYKNVHINKYK